MGEGRTPLFADSGWAKAKGAAHRSTSRPRGGAPEEGSCPPPPHLVLCLSFPELFGSSSPPAGSWLCSGRKLNLTAWLRRLFFPLGPGDGAWVKAPVARTPRGSGPSQAWEPRPLLWHELTHPGISIPSPDCALIGRSGRHALSPRSPAWCDTRAAFAVQLLLGSVPTSPQSSGNIEAGPLAGRRGAPHPHLEMCGSPACGCRGREEARP